MKAFNLILLLYFLCLQLVVYADVKLPEVPERPSLKELKASLDQLCLKKSEMYHDVSLRKTNQRCMMILGKISESKTK